MEDMVYMAVKMPPGVAHGFYVMSNVCSQEDGYDRMAGLPEM